MLPPGKSNKYLPIARAYARYFIYIPPFNILTNKADTITPDLQMWKLWVKGKIPYQKPHSVKKLVFKAKFF